MAFQKKKKKRSSPPPVIDLGCSSSSSKSFLFSNFDSSKKKKKMKTTITTATAVKKQKTCKLSAFSKFLSVFKKTKKLEEINASQTNLPSVSSGYDESAPSMPPIEQQQDNLNAGGGTEKEMEENLCIDDLPSLVWYRQPLYTIMEEVEEEEEEDEDEAINDNAKENEISGSEINCQEKLSFEEETSNKKKKIMEFDMKWEVEEEEKSIMEVESSSKPSKKSCRLEGDTPQDLESSKKKKKMKKKLLNNFALSKIMCL